MRAGANACLTFGIGLRGGLRDNRVIAGGIAAAQIRAVGKHNKAKQREKNGDEFSPLFHAFLHFMQPFQMWYPTLLRLDLDHCPYPLLQHRGLPIR